MYSGSLTALRCTPVIESVASKTTAATAPHAGAVSAPTRTTVNPIVHAPATACTSRIAVMGSAPARSGTLSAMENAGGHCDSTLVLSTLS